MLLERTQVGKREQLLDVIVRVDAKQCPVMAMIPKGPDTTNMLQDWQMDDFEDADDIAAEDGVDVESFDNASPNRAIQYTYAEYMRDSAMVSTLADKVSEVAGLPKGEVANSIMKKMRKLNRCIEAAICGDREHQAGAAGVPYKGRGLGVWIQDSAQALFPVDPNYRPPTSSIDSTAMSALTTDIMDGVLESIYTKTGERKTFNVPCGPKFKRAVTNNFGTRVTSGASSANIVRTYTTPFNHSIDNVVDMYSGDFGIVNLHPSLFLAHPRFGGSTAAQLRRAYVLDMEMTQINFKQKPSARKLENRGAGERFLCESIVSWRVLNPLGLGKFAATT